MVSLVRVRLLHMQGLVVCVDVVGVGDDSSVLFRSVRQELHHQFQRFVVQTNNAIGCDLIIKLQFLNENKNFFIWTQTRN